MAKKVQLEQCIKKEKRKLEEIRDNLECDDEIREDIRKRTARLNDNLSVRQENIDLLKGRLKDQITSFKETIAKVLYKDTFISLKDPDAVSRTRNYDRFHAHSHCVLVEVLLPDGGGTPARSKPPPKDEKSLKEQMKNKLKALPSLLGRLGMKAAEALPGIIRVILSWILNKVTDVVGWVSQRIYGIGCRHWRAALHVNDYQKVKIVLRCVVI